MIGWLVCKLKGAHAWRKARVKEDADRRYCSRCGESTPVKHRRTKENS
jgi:hypothetical protein